MKFSSTPPICKPLLRCIDEQVPEFIVLMKLVF